MNANDVLEKMSNPKFKLFYFFKLGEIEKARVFAEDAFLYAIKRYAAFKFNKVGILRSIERLFPGEIASISDKKMTSAFKRHIEILRNRREGPTEGDIAWSRVFIKSPEIKIAIEKDVFREYAKNKWLEGCKVDWVLNDDEKKRIIESIEKPNMSEKLYELLYARRHDDVREILAQCESASAFDAVIQQVIIENLDNGYPNDALEVSKEFMPSMYDTIKEMTKVVYNRE